ncbi:MAG: hypothetical protein E6Q36_01260 [Chryseobacterium sp.]|nr:MAG: hypothetical protein E6Q36_01260 [Chryseobacterium sp.]
MGYTSGWASRSSLIAHLVENDENSTCIRNCYRGGIYSGVLWSVREFPEKEDSPKRIIIFCDLLRCYGGEWGYKDLSESMGPLYYSCPLSYLQLAPEVKNQNWRNLVIEYHREAAERRKRKVA